MAERRAVRNRLSNLGKYPLGDRRVLAAIARFRESERPKRSENAAAQRNGKGITIAAGHCLALPHVHGAGPRQTSDEYYASVDGRAENCPI
jgi:hypothetical protein